MRGRGGVRLGLLLVDVGQDEGEQAADARGDEGGRSGVLTDGGDPAGVAERDPQGLGDDDDEPAGQEADDAEAEEELECADGHGTASGSDGQDAGGHGGADEQDGDAVVREQGHEGA